jgi:hypothetical protein
MGDGLIPEPEKVVYEDDEVRVSLIDPAKFMRREAMERTEPSVVERQQWARGDNPNLDIEVPVTLTAHQWAGVLATLRVGMALSTHPGIIRLMHDDIYSQLPIRKHADDDA